MPHTDIILMTGLRGQSDFVSVEVANECNIRVAPVITSKLETMREKVSDKDAFNEALKKCTYQPKILGRPEDS